MARTGRPTRWWQDIVEPQNPEAAYLAAVDAELRRAQQVGEDVAVQWVAFMTAQQCCPICGRLVSDHNRRELRRCDKSRPDLQLVG